MEKNTKFLRDKTTKNKKPKGLSVKIRDIFKNPLVIFISVVAVFCVTLISIAAVTNNIDRAKTYEITVANATDVKCQKNDQINYCSGKITLPANLAEDGKIPAQNLSVDHTEGSLSSGSSVGGLSIPESAYAEALKSGVYKTKRTLTLEDQNGSKRNVYDLDVEFTLSESDKTKLQNLQEKVKQKKAEEEKAAQEAKAKAEEAKRQREIEAENEAKQKATKKANETKRTTAHLACKHYAENKFFPYKVKFHSILGVAYDGIRTDGAWVYYVNMTISAGKGAGEVKYQAHCVVDNWNYDYSSGRVVEFSLGDWT